MASREPRSPAAVELAVVVPAYDAARFLGRSLPALRGAGPDLPVVVVDAGSTDETGALARELGARVVRLPVREGPAGARNAGVAGRRVRAGALRGRRLRAPRRRDRAGARRLSR